MLPIDGHTNGPAYRWPEGKRIAAMVTFDFDAEYLRKSRAESKGKHMGFTDYSRGLYAPHEGLRRVLECLDTTQIHCTFFIPGAVLEAYPECCREIAERGHEIAYHTYDHNADIDLPEDEALRQLETSEFLIERLAGRKPVGSRGPLGIIHPYTMAVLEKRGYLYESTMKDCDWAYPVDDSGLVELPNEQTMDDMTYWFFTFSNPAVRSMYTTREVFGNWKDEFDALAEEGNKVFILKLHPQLIGRGSRIKPLCRFIAYMQEHGAWITTCENVARYVLAHKEAYHG